MNPDEYLTIAYRGWTDQSGEQKRDSKAKKYSLTRLIVLDTETTTGVSQRFRFGFYREVSIR